MKRTTINIKKILIIIIVIFSTFTFSSCKADEENYYKIIDIPRDIEYGILTSDSYVAEGKFYHFTDSKSAESIMKSGLRCKSAKYREFPERIFLSCALHWN